ncbi:MAG: undecaprenyldiphospho-muramoylpentapeptide beta-N-acetylglucosaminyltransferase [Bradymonadaceae bacterium]|nr:undecaprenyldiphospho-muramoylpentapeptide beta-N-acetylglucosaminyltransferase [Lujinxingiaceae bacterium]
MSKENPHVVIAGGGTGGHLFPGIAVVEALEELVPSLRASFVGTAKGIEARVIPRLGYDLHLVDVASLKGAGASGLAKGLTRLPASALQSRKILTAIQPDAVISVGGYAAGPFTMVAALAGVPTALMEQNATPGLTNKMLGRLVDRAFVTFEESKSYFGKTRCEVVGNPVRRQIVERAAGFQYKEPAPNGEFRILVIGGSGGAGSFNQGVPDWMQNMGKLAQNIHVRHQAGRNRGGEVVQRYEGFAGKAEVVEFIDDMAEAYAWCDLLICRAGASTIAEVLILGVPAIYIPFPGAADNHQEKNALAVVEAGAGIMIDDVEITSDRSQRLLAGLIGNPVALANIAHRAKGLGRPEAAQTIASKIMELMK